MQAPTSYNGIKAEDDGGREDAQIANESPTAMSHAAIGTSSIRLAMATHDELADHTGDTQQQYTTEIDKDKGGSTILTRHKRETPDIAKAYCRPSRSQDDGQSATENAPFLHLQQSELVEEDKENTDGADVLDEEQIDVEQSSIAQRTPVAKLSAHDLMRYKPTYKDACEEAHDGQEQLTSDKVKEIEEVLAKERKMLAHT